MEQENKEFEIKKKEIKEHFGDLVDDTTIEILTKHSLGILEYSLDDIANIKGKVTIKGTITNKSGIREFSSKKGKGLVSNALLTVENENKSPEKKEKLKVVFWNQAAEKTKELVEGNVVKLRGFVKERDRGLEISVNQPKDIEIIEKKSLEIEGKLIKKSQNKKGFKSAILCRDGVLVFITDFSKSGQLEKIEEGSLIKAEVEKKGTEMYSISVETLAEEKKSYYANLNFKFLKLGEIVPLKSCNIRGNICGLGEIKAFKKRSLADLIISDDDERVKLILWDSSISIFREADIGDIIEVYNGYPKFGWDGEMEVHCGWNCLITLNKV